jgi:hypothetical protein
MSAEDRHTLCLQLVVICLLLFEIAFAAVSRHPQWFG